MADSVVPTDQVDLDHTYSQPSSPAPPKRRKRRSRQTAVAGTLPPSRDCSPSVGANLPPLSLPAPGVDSVSPEADSVAPAADPELSVAVIDPPVDDPMPLEAPLPDPVAAIPPTLFCVSFGQVPPGNCPTVLGIARVFRAQGIEGVSDLRQTRTGDFTFLLDSAASLAKLRALDSLLGLPFSLTETSASPPQPRKGIIHQVPTSLTEGDILEELSFSDSSTPVVSVHRIAKQGPTGSGPTGSVILTFADPPLPKHVHIAYCSYPVGIYIPRPLQCFNCYRFGHTASRCRSKQRCSLCGEAHSYRDCAAATPVCVNCSGPHSAVSSQCPIHLHNTAILRTAYTTGVSVAAARAAATPQPRSYAAVTASRPPRPPADPSTPRSNGPPRSPVAGQPPNAQPSGSVPQQTLLQHLLAFVSEALVRLFSADQFPDKVRAVLEAARRHLRPIGLSDIAESSVLTLLCPSSTPAPLECEKHPDESRRSPPSFGVSRAPSSSVTGGNVAVPS